MTMLDRMKERVFREERIKDLRGAKLGWDPYAQVSLGRTTGLGVERKSADQKQMSSINERSDQKVRSG